MFDFGSIIYIVFAIISLVVWIKYKDKDCMIYFFVSIILFCLDVWHYYAIDVLHLSGQTFIINYYVIEIIRLIAIVFIFYILFRNKEVTFKKDKDFKGFTRTVNGHFQDLSLNPHFTEFTEKNKYPYCLIIHIEINKKDSKGFPKGRAEVKDLDRTEDSIYERLKSACNVYFLARITFNGFRFLYYYIDKDIDPEVVFKPGDSKDERARKYLVSFEKDPDWAIANKAFRMKVK